MANYINKEKRQIDFDPFKLKVVALPEVVAISFQPISNKSLLIRITDQGSSFKSLKDKTRYEAILEICFNDINEADDYWGLSEKEAAEMKIFNQRHADKIYTFIDAHPDVEQIVVHCQAGVSRSSAVAMGICEHYGDLDTLEQLKTIKRYLPNPRVLAIMRGEDYTL